jgi:uncharacterized protein YraI
VRKFVLLLGCFAASPVAAGETRLMGEAIKTTLSGSVLALDTPVGSTVSVRIGHDGLMSGEAGTALGAVLGASKDRGRWWVANDQVCFKWFRWFDAEPRCATISVDGKRMSWRRDDGDTGTATIVEQNKPDVKPAVIVADAKKPVMPVQKLAEKKGDVLMAANSPEADANQAVSAHKSAAAAVPAIITHRTEAVEVALHVPAPRPAVRPNRHETIAVESVKPQFFRSEKVRAAKVQAAKVEIAKVETPKIVRKPFRVAGVNPADVLNIRNGPSPDYQSVGGIPSDSHGITITGPCLNDWCPVKHRTLIGWVNRRYLAEETVAETTAATDLNYWDATP